MSDLDDTESKVQELMSITNASRDVAESLLARLDWDLQSAVVSFLEEPSLAEDSPTQAEDYVRPPIERKKMKLIDDLPIRKVRKSKEAQPTNIFTTFRDLKEEQETIQLGNSGSKREKLADLYRPPFDILFTGTYREALGEASRTRRYLIVNIQSEKEFASHMLNRDTWYDSSVKEVVQAHFVLWQVQNSSTLAKEYMYVHVNNCILYSIANIQSRMRHHVSMLPQISIIDPDKDEVLLSWEGFVSPTDMVVRLNNFLRANPVVIDQDFQESKISRDFDELTEEEQIKAAIEASLSESFEKTSLREKRGRDNDVNVSSMNKKIKFEMDDEEVLFQDEEDEEDEKDVEILDNDVEIRDNDVEIRDNDVEIRDNDVEIQQKEVKIDKPIETGKEDIECNVEEVEPVESEIVTASDKCTLQVCHLPS